MYVDPARKLTPRQEATLAWYAAMDEYGKTWLEQERSHLVAIREALRENSPKPKRVK